MVSCDRLPQLVIAPAHPRYGGGRIHHGRLISLGEGRIAVPSQIGQPDFNEAISKTILCNKTKELGTCTSLANNNTLAVRVPIGDVSTRELGLRRLDGVPQPPGCRPASSCNVVLTPRNLSWQRGEIT